MPNQDPSLLLRTRRHFFQDCGLGLGAVALSSLLGDSAEASTASASGGAMAPRSTHYSAKAKRVIYMHMAGGPSQLELFDPKPKLRDLDGQECPKQFT